MEVPDGVQQRDSPAKLKEGFLTEELNDRIVDTAPKEIGLQNQINYSMSNQRQCYEVNNMLELSNEMACVSCS